MVFKENSHRKILSKSKKYYTYYFYCSECNIEIKSQSSAFKRHTGKCKRCTQLGEPYKFIYQELLNHKNKKFIVTLTFEEFLDIIKHPFCHYCNRKVIYNKHSKDNNINLSRAYQLDRKDNTLGYSKDNLVVCCWDCNRLKSDQFTYNEFIKLSPIIKDIYKNRK